MKQLNNMLNICIGAFIGAFIGHCIYKTVHYYSNFDLYMIHSAPWYTSIQIYGIGTLVIVCVLFIIKFFVKKKINKQQ